MSFLSEIVVKAPNGRAFTMPAFNSGGMFLARNCTMPDYMRLWTELTRQLALAGIDDDSGVLPQILREMSEGPDIKHSILANMSDPALVDFRRILSREGYANQRLRPQVAVDVTMTSRGNLTMRWWPVATRGEGDGNSDFHHFKSESFGFGERPPNELLFLRGFADLVGTYRRAGGHFDLDDGLRHWSLLLSRAVCGEHLAALRNFADPVITNDIRITVKDGVAVGCEFEDVEEKKKADDCARLKRFSAAFGITADELILAALQVCVDWGSRPRIAPDRLSKAVKTPENNLTPRAAEDALLVLTDAWQRWPGMVRDECGEETSARLGELARKLGLTARDRLVVNPMTRDVERGFQKLAVLSNPAKHATKLAGEEGPTTAAPPLPQGERAQKTVPQRGSPGDEQPAANQAQQHPADPPANARPIKLRPVPVHVPTPAAIEPEPGPSADDVELIESLREISQGIKWASVRSLRKMNSLCWRLPREFAGITAGKDLRHRLQTLAKTSPTLVATWIQDVPKQR